MANIRVKDLPNTSAPAADTDEFIIDSSSAGTRRLNYGELKTAISGDFQSGTSTYKVATLGSDNKLDPAQIPDTLSQGMNFVGVANSAGDLTSTTQGDFYVIQTAFGVYSVGDQAVYDGSAYVRVVDGTKEISEGGTGATTLDAAKTNLEIINIGSSPNQVSLNSMLGDLAFQSSAGVSAAKLEVESTTGTATTQALTVTDGSSTKFVVREDGVTGINTASPHSNSHLDVGGAIALSGTRVLTASGTDLYAGGIDGSPSIDRIFLRTADANRVTIDSSGNVNIADGNLEFNSGADLKIFHDGSNGYIQNVTGDVSLKNVSTEYLKGLIATGAVELYHNGTKQCETASTGLKFPSGKGIDFGSAATSAGQGTGTTGSVSNSVLSDYEFGSWTPTFLMSGSVNFAALTMDVVAAQYVKVGRHVHCQAYIRTDNVDTSGATGYVTVSGLPFVSDATSGNNGGASIHNSARWTNAPTTGNVPPNTARLYLQRNGTTGVSTLTAADLVNGAAANQNEVVFTASYIAST